MILHKMEVGLLQIPLSLRYNGCLPGTLFVGGRQMSELRVLIVDDQPDVVESLASCVKQWGHATAIAYSGEQAVTIAEQFDPHVVLLDIMMPNMDGYAAAQQLRTTRHRNET